MSAAEKLKANPPYVESEAGPLIPDPRWPQIVAVVEAVELQHEVRGLDTIEELTDSLAALDEALT